MELLNKSLLLLLYYIIIIISARTEFVNSSITIWKAAYMYVFPRLRILATFQICCSKRCHEVKTSSIRFNDYSNVATDFQSVSQYNSSSFVQLLS